MRYEVTTKQGKNYIVDDDSAFLWVMLERDKGCTFTEAQDLMVRGSLDVLTWILHFLSKKDGHTELKTQAAWIEHEFETFDVVDDSDPKSTEPEVSKEA